MSELATTLEAILFAAAEPVSVSALMAATMSAEEDVLAALDELSRATSTTGLRLQHHQDHWQLVTAPTAAEAVKRYLGADANIELSRAALETLAMIAYRGPITRGAIDELRGVNSDAMVRNLLQRGFINEAGRTSDAERATQYHVTQRFLEQMGLASLADLPPLSDKDANAS